MKPIPLAILRFIRHVWHLPQSLATAARQRRRQTTLDACEIERLDRIRNPSKYRCK